MQVGGIAIWPCSCCYEITVLTILRKEEEWYGKYSTGSSTDDSTNVFQKAHKKMHKANVPMWVRNTKGPRQHCETILKRYGVPSNTLPSVSPGIRLVDFFKDRAWPSPSLSRHPHLTLTSPSPAPSSRIAHCEARRGLA